ncbi:hypothetical protein D9M68_814410 [compost metagenome]
MRDHEARVQAHIVHQQHGQTKLAFQKEVTASVGDIPELGRRKAGVIQRERQGLPVEIAPADGVIAAEDDGVVSDGVQLGFGQFFQVQPGVPRGAVHLRHAAEAVGVLHPFAIYMALHDLGIF